MPPSHECSQNYSVNWAKHVGPESLKRDVVWGRREGKGTEGATLLWFNCCVNSCLGSWRGSRYLKFPDK